MLLQRLSRLFVSRYTSTIWAKDQYWNGFPKENEPKVKNRLEVLNFGMIRSADRDRAHQKKLVQNGFLREALKDWFPQGQANLLEIATS